MDVCIWPELGSFLGSVGKCGPTHFARLQSATAEKKLGSDLVDLKKKKKPTEIILFSPFVNIVNI